MTRLRANQRTTLKDVAAAANVSVMTVSNVVNGRTQYVSERTRVVVQREIERLNYRTIDAARALRTGETKTIGALVVLNPLEDRFGTRELDVAFRSFAHQAGEKGYRIVLNSKPRATALDGILEYIDGVDGVCVLSLDDHDHCRKIGRAIADAGKPVIICSPIGGEDYSENMISFVDDESSSAGAQLVSLLIRNKVKSILLLESNFISASLDDRIASAEHEAAARGISFVPLSTRHGSEAAIMEFLSKDSAIVPSKTCIVTLNERQAQSVLVVLSQHGLAVPRSIQVACLNLDPTKPYRSPDGRSEFKSAITGVWSDSWRIGSVAASALLTRLETGKFPFRTISVSCTIKQGTTTGLVARSRLPASL